MTEERWKHLQNSRDPHIRISDAELAEGWHWCAEFDGLLVGPGMGELRFCKCLPKDHPAFKTLPEDPHDTPEYAAFVDEMAKKCACVHRDPYECARIRDRPEPDDWRYVKRACECVCHDDHDDEPEDP